MLLLTVSLFYTGMNDTNTHTTKVTAKIRIPSLVLNTLLHIINKLICRAYVRYCLHPHGVGRLINVTGLMLKTRLDSASLLNGCTNYCCPNDTKLNDGGYMRRYVGNLLQLETNTCSEFDSYLCKAMFNNLAESYTADVQDDDTSGTDYEQVTEGIRYSNDGQIIADTATKQPLPEMAFSYIDNTWIPKNFTT